MSLISNDLLPDLSHKILVLRGTPISKGIAVGRAFIKTINKRHLRQNYFKSRGVEVEAAEYQRALAQLQAEFASIKKETQGNTTSLQMIDLGIALSRDAFFIKDIPAYALDHNLPAQAAVLKKLSLLKIEFDKLDNEYFRSRFDDFQAIGTRLVDILSGDISLEQLRHPSIFIAEEISPADIIRLSATKKLLAIVSIKGGTTSHAAILAESSGIPAIFGVENLLSIKSGQKIIVDAYKGHVIVDPDAKTQLIYQSIKKRRDRYEKKLIDSIRQKGQMLSGEPLSICANTGAREDIAVAKTTHADGIGLLRTEFFVLRSKDVLKEEQLFKHYSSLLAFTDMHPVTIRTMDLGGDKFAESTGENPLGEANPFLGYRSTRMFMDDDAPFRMQIRALLRASIKNPNIRIMFPFITTLEDFFCLKKAYDEEAAQFRPQLPHIDLIPVGIMAEVPSVILCLEDFLPHVQFVSIGTNDLTQYTMAVDRNNPYVSAYYQNAHPSVLKLIQQALALCNEAGVPVSLCGEMAKEPYFTRLFLGMGLRNFSLNPAFIPLVKFIAIHSTREDCEALVQKALSLKSSGEIIAALDKELQEFLTARDAAFDYKSVENRS